MPIDWGNTIPPSNTWIPDVVPNTLYSQKTAPMTVYGVDPIIIGISPESGNGGTTVTISGFYFTGAVDVLFGTQSTLYKVIDDNTISVTAPDPLPGISKVSVVVVGPRIGIQQPGQNPTSNPAIFTYINTLASWDFFTVSGVSLTNNDLTAINELSFNTGNGVEGLNPQSSGAYYWEITVDNGDNLGGIGVCSVGASYANLNNDGTGGVIAYAAGQVWSNGSRLTVNGFNAAVAWNAGAGTVLGIALDIGAGKVWFKVMQSLGGGSFDKSSYWNDSNNNAANAGNDPSLDSGGLAVPGGSLVPFVNFGSAAGTQFTANFGQNNFALGALPAGYSLWPG